MGRSNWREGRQALPPNAPCLRPPTPASLAWRSAPSASLYKYCVPFTLQSLQHPILCRQVPRLTHCITDRQSPIFCVAPDNVLPSAHGHHGSRRKSWPAVLVDHDRPYKGHRCCPSSLQVTTRTERPDGVCNDTTPRQTNLQPTNTSRNKKEKRLEGQGSLCRLLPAVAKASAVCLRMQGSCSTETPST